MSGLIAAPAGELGPLQRDAERFVFRDRPGDPVKFWGINTGSILPTAELQEQQARLLVKHGVNLVRLHPVQSRLGLLQRDPVTIHPDAKIYDATRIMIENRVNVLPVVEEGSLVGIFTEIDVMRYCIEVIANYGG